VAPAVLLLNQRRRRDPAKILGIQTRLVREIDRRYRDLKEAIRRKVIDEDFLGIGANQNPNSMRIHAGYDFAHSEAKVNEFMDWLREQEKAKVLDIVPGHGTLPGPLGDAWVDSYHAKALREAYAGGIKQADAEIRKVGYKPLGTAPKTAIDVTWAMNGPIHAGTLSSVYSRTLEDLRTVTVVSDARVRQVMADGLRVDLVRGMAEGRHPYAIAREMLKDVNAQLDKIGRTRARLIARTETARAHHLATIAEFRDADAAMRVAVQAEILTAGDENVCEECADYEGKTLTLDEAEDLIPVHPNCRCTVVPVMEEAPKEEPAAPEVAEPEPMPEIEVVSPPEIEVVEPAAIPEFIEPIPAVEVPPPIIPEAPFAIVSPETEPLPEGVEAAIRQHTALGGPASSKFIATDAERIAMYDWVGSGMEKDPAYRILSFDNKEWAVLRQEMQVGKVLENPQYGLVDSWSKMADRAPYKGGDVFVRLETRGSFVGRDISKYSVYTAEQEIATPINARWKILEVIPEGGRSYRIVVEQVGMGPDRGKALRAVLEKIAAGEPVTPEGIARAAKVGDRRP
jgi:SPP1 gp7 family putative phage head morphogenesis protein